MRGQNASKLLKTTEAIKTALIPFNDCINENGAVLRTLKEEMDSLSKNLATITTNVDNLQGSLRKTKKIRICACLRLNSCNENAMIRRSVAAQQCPPG